MTPCGIGFRRKWRLIGIPQATSGLAEGASGCLTSSTPVERLIVTIDRDERSHTGIDGRSRGAQAQLRISSPSCPLDVVKWSQRCHLGGIVSMWDGLPNELTESGGLYALEPVLDAVGAPAESTETDDEGTWTFCRTAIRGHNRAVSQSVCGRALLRSRCRLNADRVLRPARRRLAPAASGRRRAGRRLGPSPRRGAEIDRSGPVREARRARRVVPAVLSRWSW